MKGPRYAKVPVYIKFLRACLAGKMIYGGRTQYEVALSLNISPQFFSNMMRGTQRISKEAAVKMARFGWPARAAYLEQCAAEFDAEMSDNAKEPKT